MIVTIEGMKLESLANKREHWAVRARRAKAQRQTAYLLCKDHPLPCTVTITRIAPRPLDDDNNQIAAKSVRDGVADRLGIDDRDKRVEWRYKQERGFPKQYAVVIEIESQ